MLTTLALCFLTTMEPALPTAVRLEVGLGASNGEVGLSASRDLLPWLRAEAGMGYGYSGLQLSSMVRFVLGDRHRFIPGAGLSLGIPVNGSAFLKGHDGDPLVMPWLNIDGLGYEYQDRRGLNFSIALGATVPLRDAHWDAIDLGGNVHALEDWLPQAHVAVGMAF
jgi:hypothetical protein